MTRRTLLAAGAGAAAARLLTGPAATAVAALGPHPPRIGETAVGTLAPGAVRTVALSENADLVGLQWRGPSAPGLQLRFAASAGPGSSATGGRSARGAFGPWMSADGHGHAPEGGLARGAAAGEPVGEPLWTGGTRLVQVRAPVALGSVRLHTVDVSAGFGAARLARSPAAAAVSAAMPLATSPLAAGPGVPAIVARRAWARGGAAPQVNPAYGEVRLAFVHHTENPNGYSRGEVPAMLLAIYGFHRFVNGWNDIGYNFVVDRFGRIFEARAGGIEEPVVGAQAGGYNVYSTGVGMLGTFAGALPPAPALAALERLLAWKLSLHGAPVTGRTTVKVTRGGAVYSRFPAGTPVSLRRISGHRDGDSTVCPGDALYAQLPRIRARVQAITPPPTVVTLGLAPPATAPQPQPAPAPASAGAPTAAATPSPPATLTGTVAVLGGAPVAGARVTVQVRRLGARGRRVQELDIATATTDPQGRFAAALPEGAVGRAGLSLRAVYEGAPAGAARAAVSPPLQLRAAQLRPPPAPAPSPQAPAPPAP